MKRIHQTTTKSSQMTHNVFNLSDYQHKPKPLNHRCMLWSLLVYGTEAKVSQWKPLFEEVQSWIPQYTLQQYKLISRTQISVRKWLIDFSLTYTHKTPTHKENTKCQ